MQIKNKTSRILLMRRLLASGKEFERQRILPSGLSKPFIPTDWETIEINEVTLTKKKAR